MPKFQFTRDTTKREDSVLHAKDDVYEMTEEQAARWIRRGAVVEVASGAKAKSAPASDAKPDETKTGAKAKSAPASDAKPDETKTGAKAKSAPASDAKPDETKTEE